jgi:histidine triad (HIT) family protein
MGCIFCKIIAGEIPCNKVYEDDSSLAFLDNNPRAKGHTLVIPKVHRENIDEITDEELSHVMLATKKTIKKISEKLQPGGYNVGWNDKAIGGQEVPHMHVHILPRYEDDGGTNMHAIVNNSGDLSVEDVTKLFKE